MAAPTVLLAPGIYRIPTLGNAINSFAVLPDDGSVTLIDCGLKRAPRTIVEALASIGRHPSDVTRIVLTHAHADHAGGANEMIEHGSADGVDVHVDDAEYFRTGRAAPGASSGLGRLIARGPAGSFTAVGVARELVDGELIDVAGGLRVLHTPGHTPGHISLLHEPTGVLITGDVIFNMTWGLSPRMTWPLSTACTNAPLNQQSAHVLAEADYAIAAFTHGPEIRDDAREQVRGFVQRKTRT